MLEFIKSLFSHHNTTKADWVPERPKPSWPEIVDLMYDKGLSSFIDDVIQVVYSTDREKRIVILKSKYGYYSYCIEQLVEFDDDEWLYVSRDPDSLPAMWEGLQTVSGLSLFGTEQEAWNDLINLPEYKTYFSDKPSM